MLSVHYCNRMEKSISMGDLSRLLDSDCDDDQLIDFFAKRKHGRRKAFDINGISNLQLDVQFETIKSPKTQSADIGLSRQEKNSETNKINTQPLSILQDVGSPKRIMRPSPRRSLSKSGGPVQEHSLRRVSLRRLTKLSTRRTLLKEMEESDLTTGFDPPICSTPMSTKSIEENDENQPVLSEKDALVCSRKDANAAEGSNHDNDAQMVDAPVVSKNLCNTATRYEVVDMDESAQHSFPKQNTLVAAPSLVEPDKSKSSKSIHTSPQRTEQIPSPLSHHPPDVNDVSDFEIPETQEQQIEEEKNEEIEQPVEAQNEKTVVVEKNSLINATAQKSIVNSQGQQMEIENDKIMPEDVSLCLTENEADVEASMQKSDAEGSGAPLNLAAVKCRTLRSRNLRSQQSTRREVPLDESEILSKKHRIGPPPAHVASDCPKKVKAQKTRIPLNKAPRTPINGEPFAVELKQQIARRIKYDTLDLRKRKSSIKTALSQSKLDGKKQQEKEKSKLEQTLDQREESHAANVKQQQQQRINDNLVDDVDTGTEIESENHIIENDDDGKRCTTTSYASVREQLEKTLKRVQSRILETTQENDDTIVPMETVIPAPPGYQNDAPIDDHEHIELDRFIDDDDNADIVTFSQPQKKPTKKRSKAPVVNSNPEVLQNYINVTKQLNESKRKSQKTSLKRSLYSKGYSDDERTFGSKNDSLSFRIHRNPLILPPPSPFSESSTIPRTPANQADSEECNNVHNGITSDDLLPSEDNTTYRNCERTTQTESETPASEEFVFKMPKAPSLKPKSKNNNNSSKTKIKKRVNHSSLPEEDHNTIEQSSDNDNENETTTSLRRSKRTPTPAKRPLIDILFAKHVYTAMEAIQKRAKERKSNLSKRQNKIKLGSSNPLGDTTDASSVSSVSSSIGKYSSSSSSRSVRQNSGISMKSSLQTISEEQLSTNHREDEQNKKRVRPKGKKKVKFNGNTESSAPNPVTNEITESSAPNPVTNGTTESSAPNPVTSTNFDEIFDKLRNENHIDCEPMACEEVHQPTSTTSEVLEKNLLDSPKQKTLKKKSKKKTNNKKVKPQETVNNKENEDVEMIQEQPTCSTTSSASSQSNELVPVTEPINCKIRKLRVRVKRCHLPEIISTTTKSNINEIPIQDEAPSQIVEKQTKDLVSWLKSVPNVGMERLPPVSVANISSFATKDLYFSEKDGIEYAFYNAECDSNLGYIRFKPRQLKKQCRTKLFTLHFVTLSEKFKFTTDAGEVMCNSGSMVCVQKGSSYKIENLSDDIGLMLCIRS